MMVSDEQKSAYLAGRWGLCLKGEMFDLVRGRGLTGGDIFNPQYDGLSGNEPIAVRWNGHHDFVQVLAWNPNLREITHPVRPYP